MPASLAYEEKVLNQVLKKEAFTATETFLGISSLTHEGTLTKKTTGKEFGEAEPTEANAWARVRIDNMEWTVTKEEGATGFTKYVNKNAIKGAGGAGEFKKVSGGEVVCKTFAVLEKPKQTEVGPILVFGKLTTPITVNAAATLEIAAGALVIEVE